MGQSTPSQQVAGTHGGARQAVADRFFLSTLGPIPRLWCLACDKSEHAAEPGEHVEAGRLAELRETHRCGPRTSPWDAAGGS